MNLLEDNLKIIDRFFKSYMENDIDGVNAVLDKNAEWIFPGHNPFSGKKTGIEEIVKFYDAMSELMGRFNMVVEKLITSQNKDFVIECQHIIVKDKDTTILDIEWCILWKFCNGKIIQGKHFSVDQDRADIFFNKV